MNKTVCVVTTTRADYGILKPLVSRLQKEEMIRLRIVASGMHLREEFGNTYHEIEGDGFVIHQKIDILSGEDTPKAMSEAMGKALIQFGTYFEQYPPGLLIVLGDRFEMYAVCGAAVNQRIPIAHFHGGETTQGAIDECYRHSITKMSWLHFVTCEPYRRRVIQLGEDPDRVYNVGALGVENALNAPLISLAALEQDMGIELQTRPYCVVTFHPASAEQNTAGAQLRALMEAMDTYPNMGFIVTKSNADEGGREINRLWDEYGKYRDNVHVTASLGMVKYLSALRGAKAIVGNSSSGILEAPPIGVPTVNIGDRQKGRLQATSVINAGPQKGSIINAMDRAFSDEFVRKARRKQSLYGDGNTSRLAAEIIRERLLQSPPDLKKKFYDIVFEV
jgi:GDP/UDP-N,N'-diacetylbacillosamine 2-epimerase (hydrolysing)